MSALLFLLGGIWQLYPGGNVRTNLVVGLLAVVAGAAGCADHIKVVTRPSTATIYRDGSTQIGTGSADIEIVRDDQSVVVLACQPPEYECVQEVVKRSSPMVLNLTLPLDVKYASAQQALAATVQFDMVNKPLNQEVAKGVGRDDAWQKIVSVISERYDVIETIDSKSGYLRTAWIEKPFGTRILRSRFVVSIGTPDPLVFKLKIQCEFRDVKQGDFAPYARVFPGDLELVEALRGRLAQSFGENAALAETRTAPPTTETATPPPAKAAPPPKQAKPSTAKCAPAQVAKLSQAGLSADQISAVCAQTDRGAGSAPSAAVPVAQPDAAKAAPVKQEPAKPEQLVLKGRLAMSGTNAVALYNDTSSVWHGCEVRMPSKKFFRFEASMSFKAGESSNIGISKFEQDAREPDQYMLQGYALVRCDEAQGYMWWGKQPL